jgi:hypothetical protein
MLDWLATTWNEFKSFLWSIVLSVQEMHKDLTIWMFDSLLDITRLALEGVDSYFDGLDITAYTSSIPPEVGWFLNQIGVPQALTMIVTALTIRLVLQLIPFTRLGS